MKNKLILIAAILIAGFVGIENYSDRSKPGNGETAAQSNHSADAAFTQAYESRATKLQIAGSGTVAKVLSDDNDGSRHQRFIIRLGSGQTLLVAHNIDLAPRVAALKAGDTVEFYGQYEWSDKGGVIHWTHADPGGRHVAGWIKHNGQTYQ